MSHKIGLQMMVVVLIGLFAVGLLALLNPGVARLPSLPEAPALGPSKARAASVEGFDAEKAADISAARWLAMAKGYERLGLLNEKMDAGDVSAFRWRAMAEGYKRLGLLNE